MQRNQQGFTLIELVIVIVILGILSAFALPRFADLGGDARAATIDGVAGAMRSASSITRSACLADAGCQDSEASSQVTLEGQEITTVYGYPSAERAGIIEASQIDENEFDVSSDDDGAGGSITVGIEGTTDCEVQYTTATEDGGDFDEGSTVVVTDTGC